MWAILLTKKQKYTFRYLPLSVNTTIHFTFCLKRLLKNVNSVIKSVYSTAKKNGNQRQLQRILPKRILKMKVWKKFLKMSVVLRQGMNLASHSSQRDVCLQLISQKQQIQGFVAPEATTSYLLTLIELFYVFMAERCDIHLTLNGDNGL